MHIIVILSISLACCLALIFVTHKYIKFRDRDYFTIGQKAVYNGKKLFFPLSTINSIGFSFYGSYRLDITTGSSAKYMFFCIFLPLFPVGCYRVSEGTFQYSENLGTSQVSKTKYTIYGTEKWNFIELLNIYLYIAAIVLVFLIIYNSWDYIF